MDSSSVRSFLYQKDFLLSAVNGSVEKFICKTRSKVIVMLSLLEYKILIGDKFIDGGTDFDKFEARLDKVLMEEVKRIAEIKVLVHNGPHDNEAYQVTAVYPVTNGNSTMTVFCYVKPHTLEQKVCSTFLPVSIFYPFDKFFSDKKEVTKEDLLSMVNSTLKPQ